jgi:hypothetical protein
MIWPNLCIDNFFNEPDKVVEFANSLKFTKPDNHNYPGKRTQYMHLINFEFFEFSTLKILSLLYPNECKKLKWTAHQAFQKVPANLKYDGWIHTDEQYEFTCIIYLSKFLNCGTSIYHPINSHGYIKNTKEKNEYFEHNDPEKFLKTEKAYKENNGSFEETIKFNSKYNRLILFDGASYHSSNIFKHENNKEERLTLITFFKKIEFINDENLKKPITAMRRIN